MLSYVAAEFDSPYIFMKVRISDLLTWKKDFFSPPDTQSGEQLIFSA